MLIGEAISLHRYNLINKSKDKITNKNLIIIEKPSKYSDLMNLNNMLT